MSNSKKTINFNYCVMTSNLTIIAKVSFIEDK